ncbi:glycosyltransferase 61 family protein [Paracoccus luteus]|uniref:glycosyltransferase 61 family protein n=1 Tax=Paracoccus luteus TaxID=2508543 RepID=UPI001430BF81|nr:glycosyltransferase family 61 protein [Paracoccus luteus]
MISFRPGLNALRSRLGRPVPDIAAMAEITAVEPGGDLAVPPVLCLPGMLDRMRGTEFASAAEVTQHFTGGFDSPQPPTLAMRLTDVDLVGGVLYAGAAARHLQAQRGHPAWHRAPPDAGRATLFESWIGNTYFGNWLAEDCVTWLLAERVADSPIVTTRPPPVGHMSDYQSRLGMDPAHLTTGRFDEMVLFDDHGANPGQQARAAEQRRRLIAGFDATPHPGVFVLRGTTGMQRILADEQALADRLARERGVTILDPRRDDAATIIAACAGARIAIGNEGSQLAHALVAMAPGTGLLTIHPPDRVNGGLKLMTDRRLQDYGILIGTGSARHFAVDGDELMATFDLMAEAA